MSLFSPVRIEHGTSDEAEKPFWISYADLMTSLMILFLVVMLASLATLTRTVSDLRQTRSRSEILAEKYRQVQRERRRDARLTAAYEQQIDRFWGRLSDASRGMGVRINPNTNTIDFGDRARFATGSDRLSDASQTLLRGFTPTLLDIAESDLGRRVLNRVVVEGYADRRGDYLYNLDLSLSRSERVLCTLVAPGGAGALSVADKQRVRRLFSVGGFSFNDQRKSLAASRRVEIRLDILPRGGSRTLPPPGNPAFGDCPLD